MGNRKIVEIAFAQKKTLKNTHRNLVLQGLTRSYISRIVVTEAKVTIPLISVVWKVMDVKQANDSCFLL